MTPDLGSAFTSISRKYSDNGALTTAVTLPIERWLSTDYGYSGPLLGVNPLLGADGMERYPKVNLDELHYELYQKGSTAIARTIPTNPSSETGAAIAESVERLPRLPGSALFGKAGNVSKRFADEYLNYEFGVKPTISEIDSTVQAIRNTNRILEQLERDSGRLVRRRYDFPVERTNHLVSSDAVETSFPLLHTRQYKGAGLRQIYRETVKRTWFSGAYTYYYAQGSDLWARLRRAEQAGNRLFGLRLTPSLAWELAPWSWAADWVTNAGDVIKNLSAFSRDGLVLQWGYIMCDYVVRDTITQRINHSGGISRPVQVFETRVKMRRKATPYGFGLDPDWRDLSPRQLAILGALGISRG